MSCCEGKMLEFRKECMNDIVPDSSNGLNISIVSGRYSKYIISPIQIRTMDESNRNPLLKVFLANHF